MSRHIMSLLNMSRPNILFKSAVLACPILTCPPPGAVADHNCVVAGRLHPPVGQEGVPRGGGGRGHGAPAVTQSGETSLRDHPQL